jgi:hypothetical protein
LIIKIISFVLRNMYSKAKTFLYDKDQTCNGGSGVYSSGNSSCTNWMDSMDNTDWMDDTKPKCPIIMVKSVKKDPTNVYWHQPEIFGPVVWKLLHNTAKRYPINPSMIYRERMKMFILSIPLMLPCDKCIDHCTSYIESEYKNMDNIVSSRKNLFNFFVDMHNYVNKRYNKKVLTYDEAWNLY